MTQFLWKCATNKLGTIYSGGGDMGQGGICVDVSLKEDVFNYTVSLSMTYQTIPQGPNAAAGVAGGFLGGIPGQLQDYQLGINGFVGVPIASLPNNGGLEPQPPFSNATRGGLAYQLAVQFFAQACYTNPTQVGGCDPTGLIPPDLLNYNGQCPGQLQVLVYQTLGFTPGTNNVTGGRTFRGPNPAKGGYFEYTTRSDYDTKKAIAMPLAGAGIMSGLAPYFGTTGGLGAYAPTESPLPTPTQSPTGTSCQTLVVLQLFQSYTILEVKWSIERYGCMVEAPSPIPVLQGYTLLRMIQSPVNMDLLPDTYTPVYKMSGSYVYAVSCPVLELDPLPFAIPPWVNMPPSEFTEILPADWIDGVINNDIA